MARSKEQPKPEEFPYRKISDWNQSSDVCGLLFKQIDKPLNYKMCKAINVYDNKYRINVYTHETVNDIQSQRISQSYFAKLADDGASLEILMKPAAVDSKKKR